MSKSERADDLFILETLQYSDELMGTVIELLQDHGKEVDLADNLKADVQRCIKILEDRKDAQ